MQCNDMIGGRLGNRGVQPAKISTAIGVFGGSGYVEYPINGRDSCTHFSLIFQMKQSQQSALGLGRSHGLGICLASFSHGLCPRILI